MGAAPFNADIHAVKSDGCQRSEGAGPIAAMLCVFTTIGSLQRRVGACPTAGMYECIFGQVRSGCWLTRDTHNVLTRFER